METNPESPKIELDQGALNHLNTARKWSMFLAILGFIFLGLFVLIGLATGTFLSAFSSGAKGIGVPGALIIVLFVILGVACFLPVLFLFKFSKHMTKAVNSIDKQEINKAFRSLKFYFTYIGILVIIILILYLTALVIAGATMAFIKGL